jgi:phage tail protein X
MMADYKPDLPEGIALPAGASINVEHADYKALTAVARKEGWSQSPSAACLALRLPDPAAQPRQLRILSRLRLRRSTSTR